LGAQQLLLEKKFAENQRIKVQKQLDSIQNRMSVFEQNVNQVNEQKNQLEDRLLSSEKWMFSTFVGS
jgi:hypothetical protein